MERRYEEDQERLRQQQADPVLRQRDFDARLQALRNGSPDFARVLGIDADTAETLLKLLVDEEIAKQFAPNPFTGLGPRSLAVMAAQSTARIQREALEYDRQLQAISQIIGATRLDAYLDYTATRTARQQVDQFNRTLPYEMQLSDQQKDTLVSAFAEDAEQRSRRALTRPPMFSLLAGSRVGSGPLATGDFERRLQIYNLQSEELRLRATEAENRQLLARLAQLLNAEQLERYTQLQEQRLAPVRSRFAQLRTELGIGAEEELPPNAPELQLETKDSSGNTELKVRVRINGKEVTKTLKSRGGRSVSFTGPEALTVEVQPALTRPNTLKVEIKFYESVRGTRRLIGESSSYQLFGAAPTGPVAALNGPAGSQSLLRGRKAYLYDWHVSARRL
jgi:hypothetical protein